jgi:TraB/PrgY/gumN family
VTVEKPKLRSFPGRVLPLCLGLAVASSALRGAEPPSPSDSVPEVLVAGERPGPGMWRVAKGSHTLWILATLVPLPRKMTWRSHAVETRIANSGVVLAPPAIVADVGFFSDPVYTHAIGRAERNPQGGTLEQVLSPELYSRWRNLRARYMGGYDEHARPILAARDLFQQVVDLSGLTMHETVWKSVIRIAHRKHVKILPVVIELKMDSPDDWIREFTQIPSDPEVTCLERTIERIETDLEPMRRRANLWSLGDIDGLLALTFPDEKVACFNALFSVPRLHDQLEDAGGPLESEWLAAADSALTRNESSFAVLPISQLLKPDGWLAKLRARGYLVQEPDAPQ